MSATCIDVDIDASSFMGVGFFFFTIGVRNMVSSDLLGIVGTGV